MPGSSRRARARARHERAGRPKTHHCFLPCVDRSTEFLRTLLSVSRQRLLAPCQFVNQPLGFAALALPSCNRNCQTCSVSFVVRHRASGYSPAWHRDLQLEAPAPSCHFRMQRCEQGCCGAQAPFPGATALAAKSLVAVFLIFCLCRAAPALAGGRRAPPRESAGEARHTKPTLVTDRLSQTGGEAPDPAVAAACRAGRLRYRRGGDGS